MSGRTWNEEFEQFRVSYSLLDIQNYFEYIIQKSCNTAGRKTTSSILCQQNSKQSSIQD